MGKRIIQRGFTRTDFVQQAEKEFDNKFKYGRELEETFDYCYAIKSNHLDTVKDTIKGRVNKNTSAPIVEDKGIDIDAEIERIRAIHLEVMQEKKPKSYAMYHQHMSQKGINIKSYNTESGHIDDRVTVHVEGLKPIEGKSIHSSLTRSNLKVLFEENKNGVKQPLKEENIEQKKPKKEVKEEKNRRPNRGMGMY